MILAKTYTGHFLELNLT